MRVGLGYDIHRLVAGRKFLLGGVEIPFDKGPLGHSDGDCLYHALTDALLGAAALGDIGRHFSDTDPRWKDADSSIFLKETVKKKVDRASVTGCRPVFEWGGKQPVILTEMQEKRG